VVDVRDELEDVNLRRLVDRMIRRYELLLIAATETEQATCDSGAPPLDAGERATLAAAAARGWSVAVNERLGRQVAARRVGSGRVTGTIGILRAAVDSSLITPRTGECPADQDDPGRLLLSGGELDGPLHHTSTSSPRSAPSAAGS
jgi:predicted nucleic acid-binding protein